MRQSVNESGQTLVLITHDPQVAAQADRVIHAATARVEKPRKSRAGPSRWPRPATASIPMAMAGRRFRLTRRAYTRRVLRAPSPRSVRRKARRRADERFFLGKAVSVQAEAAHVPDCVWHCAGNRAGVRHMRTGRQLPHDDGKRAGTGRRGDWHYDVSGIDSWEDARAYRKSRVFESGAVYSNDLYARFSGAGRVSEQNYGTGAVSRLLLADI